MGSFRLGKAIATQRRCSSFPASVRQKEKELHNSAYWQSLTSIPKPYLHLYLYVCLLLWSALAWLHLDSESHLPEGWGRRAATVYPSLLWASVETLRQHKNPNCLLFSHSFIHNISSYWSCAQTIPSCASRKKPWCRLELDSDPFSGCAGSMLKAVTWKLLAFSLGPEFKASLRSILKLCLWKQNRNKLLTFLLPRALLFCSGTYLGRQAVVTSHLEWRPQVFKLRKSLWVITGKLIIWI